MAHEDTVLEEALDNLKEGGQRIRATQSLMRSLGMTDIEDYGDLLTRLSTALAMTEAAYLEARRRRDFCGKQPHERLAKTKGRARCDGESSAASNE